MNYKKEIERWGTLEISLSGPSKGNPYIEHNMKGRFNGNQEDIVTDGFYDGDGIYKVRFMPSFEGDYTFTLQADFLESDYTGHFHVTKAQGNNHGPVQVRDTYHFAYADGTPYYSVGTTCYVWNMQSDEQVAETLETLKKSCFNKIRFCLFPKHYDYNLYEPRSYPYEGTPMDSSVLNSYNFYEYDGKSKGNTWDFFRFNPMHFQHIEYCIQQLLELGIEADLIVMHPYDRWGFSCMTQEQDDLYWKYVIARFSAYRNVWWSLANEYDLLKEKTEADWERYARIICEKDAYGHLRSIHQFMALYDHSRPWITHCSIQGKPEEVHNLRQKYQKPVVMDEMGYEGNIAHPWGNITAQEMVRRFWETICKGGYPGHGETYLHPDDRLWWSHGGKLHGESWKRFEFLAQIMSETPGVGLKLEKDIWGIFQTTPQVEDQEGVKSYYIYYYGIFQPAVQEYYLDDETEFDVEILDTWNMTVKYVGRFKGRFGTELPGMQYIAVRLKRACV